MNKISILILFSVFLYSNLLLFLLSLLFLGLDLQEGREGGTWFGISVLGNELLDSRSEHSIVRMRMGALLNVSVGDVLYPIDPSARGRGMNRRDTAFWALF